MTPVTAGFFATLSPLPVLPVILCMVRTYPSAVITWCTSTPYPSARIILGCKDKSFSDYDVSYKRTN